MGARFGRRVLVAATVVVGTLVVLFPAGAAGAATATGTPDAPGSVRAVALEGSATVSWAAPASTGSGPVTGYVITTSPAGAGGATLDVPGTSLTTTVGGLANGTAYRFTVAATNASGTGAASASTTAVVPSHPGGSYVPVTPYRICDTRTGPTASVLSGTDAQCSGNTLVPGGTLTVQVAGTDPTGTTSGGVPTSGVSAVVLNVTATNTTAPSYLTIFPSGSARPVASSLNWTAGETVPNLVQVALGPDGKVTLYNAQGKTDVVIDVEGYVTTAPASAAGLYQGLTPYRICDTRTGPTASVLSGTDAQCSGRTLGPGGTLTVQVAGTDPTGTSSGGVPTSGVSAVVLNVTATNTSAQSYLTVYPAGSARPVASNLNWVAGETVPNRVEVPLGSGGTIRLYNPAGQTDVVIDVTGYYTTSTTEPGSYFSGFSPSRICDTRAGNPSGLTGAATQCTGKTLGPGATLPVQVTGVGGVPNESTTTPAVAVVLNVTVTNPTAQGYLTVYPAGSAQPVASDLNWVPGETVANLVPVTLGTSGQIDVYNSTGQTDVVIDVVGYQAGANVIPPSTVTLSPASLALFTSVSANQSSLTFSGTDAQLSGLVPGDVLTSGPTPLAPTGLLLTVTGLTPSGGGLTVTTTPASLTQVAPQGSFDLAGGPINLLNPTTDLAPSVAQARPFSADATTPSNNMTKFLQSVTCSGSVNPPTVSYSAGFTTFTVTPYFHASWHWGLPPSVSISTALRLDETYQASASITESGTNSVSVACSSSVPIPGINNLMLSNPIPITIGPVDFTLTPVLQASVGVTAAGSLSGTTGFSATQSAYATAGVRYANGSFSPDGGTGCDPPVKSGTPLCTTMTGSNDVGAALQLSVGPTFSLVGAIDAIASTCSITTHFCYVGGPVIGPELSLTLSAEGTLQNSAPIWSVGFNLTAGVGFTANWTVGPITLNLTYQDNLVNATATLAHAVEIDTASLPGATVGSSYADTLKASGGSTPYLWSFAPGKPAPPAWLSLSPGGVLSGTPPSSVANTTVTVPVQVTDASGVTATPTSPLSLTTVLATLQVVTTTLANAAPGSAYSATLEASGGAAPYSWAVAGGSTLPNWLSLSSAGVLSGTPPATTPSSTGTFTVQVTDSTGAQATQTLTIQVRTVVLGDVRSITGDSAGSYCAVLTTGGVDCWGDNASGELGNGTTTNSSVPVAVTGITDAASVSTDGDGSYCAVLTTGGVDCWGYNFYGELGNGTTTDSSVPVAVTGITDATSVSTDGSNSFGNDSYCAVLTTGGVDCWGYNGNGELGNGTTTNSSVPVAVTGITDATSVSTDGSSSFGFDSYCAVLTTGGVDCWGYNGNGELGNGTTTQSSVPVAVTGITDATSVSTDGYFSYCAVLTTGGVDCWGLNGNGELGNGTTTNSSVPVAVTGITDATSVSTDGLDSFCAVLTTGGVDCWGYNFYAELGNGTTTDSSVPVAVTGITDATSVSASGSAGSYCAVLTTGGVDCWGYNLTGDLGNGTTTNSSVPVAVTGITDATSVSADGLRTLNDEEPGAGSYCAVLTTGGVDCWGNNGSGELGNGTTTDSSVPVAVLPAQ